jgi:hypothetical protein
MSPNLTNLTGILRVEVCRLLKQGSIESSLLTVARTPNMMTGWSAYGGQTLSPYVGKIKPGEKILGHSVSG